MNWQKRGLVFSPSGSVDWMRTHAQVPTPLLCDGYIRIYFSSRPQRTLSLTSFVDVDCDDPSRILRVNKVPILDLGKPGTFDEHGIMPSCAIRDGSAVLLYYSGWSRGASVPYTNSTGLAISADGGKTFRKVSEGPVLGRSFSDPYSATSPTVLKEGNSWHMWYCSGIAWLEVNNKYEHTYDIKLARSDDGIAWIPDGKPAISQQTEYEAITRPFVIKRLDGYHMWFCYRGSHDFRDGQDAYRIAHAYSVDGQCWQRSDDEVGLGTSKSGWDSKMVAYPSVVTIGNRTLMFYNGNDFGAVGFGYAVLEED